MTSNDSGLMRRWKELALLNSREPALYIHDRKGTKFCTPTFFESGK